MRASIRALLGAVAVGAIGFIGYAWYTDGRGAEDDGPYAGPVPVAGTPAEQGRYLAAAANCTGCHTVPDGTAYAGGVAFQLPFGTLYSSNLTPDPATGIGAWSDEDFLRAVRSGVGRGGHHLYPAHPYPSYAAMARDDVLAIKAFLFSLPAVRTEVAKSDLRFPFSQRWGMPFWNALFLDGKRFRPDPTHDAAWNRGAYLATALGHCGECHTPRNAAYALRRDRALAGAVTQGWKAYDITANADSGIGSWSPAALTEYLETGHAAGHGAATGPMKEVVADSTSQLTADDHSALATYLLAGARAGAIAQTTTAAASAAEPHAAPGQFGAALYFGACAACHPLDPSPAPTYYSDLRGSRSARDSEGTNLLRLLVEGSPGGVRNTVSMPAFAPAYSDAERAALANFVLAQWGGVAPRLTPKDAMRARQPD